MQTLLLVGLSAAVWSFLHSFFITHGWQRWQRRRWPGLEPFSRLIYVLANTLTLTGLMTWWWLLPARSIWDWPGSWAWLRWAGMASAAGFFYLGARAYDNRAFLGISQIEEHWQGRPHRDPPFTRRGILARVRHPWYAGSVLFFVFCLPVTDINLVWRGAFLIYTLMGTELEERKLLAELGSDYARYRQDVGRFWPKF